MYILLLNIESKQFLQTFNFRLCDYCYVQICSSNDILLIKNIHPVNVLMDVKQQRSPALLITIKDSNYNSVTLTEQEGE
jgi:hypothetical protein